MDSLVKQVAPTSGRVGAPHIVGSGSIVLPADRGFNVVRNFVVSRATGISGISPRFEHYFLSDASWEECPVDRRRIFFHRAEVSVNDQCIVSEFGFQRMPMILQLRDVLWFVRRQRGSDHGDDALAKKRGVRNVFCVEDHNEKHFMVFPVWDKESEGFTLDVFIPDLFEEAKKRWSADTRFFSHGPIA